jgi:hexokinase
VAREEGTSRVRRHLDKSWPIGELLKKDKAEDLFAWIGRCILEVVQEAFYKFEEVWRGVYPDEIPMGVTFSFPMMLVHSCCFSSLP